jgi:hypothetical protein
MIGFMADYVVRDIQIEALAVFKEDMRRQWTVRNRSEHYSESTVMEWR